MVNEAKVRIMTRVALDESKYGESEFSKGAYFKSDYIRFHIAAAIFDISMAYFGILVLIGMYFAENMITNLSDIPLKKIGLIIGIIYILFVIVVGLISYLYYNKKYIENKKIIQDYCNKLRYLDDYYKSLEEETNDSATGI